MTKGQPRNIWHLFIAVIGISLTGWYINTFAPKNWFIIAGFFFVFFLTWFFLLLYLLNNVRRAFMLTIGVSGIFMLRSAGLRDILYILLLAATIILLEAYLTKK